MMLVIEDDLWEGEMRGERGVLLVRLDGEVHAYADRCAHLGQPLSTGTLAGRVITCAAHHWTYDACTGCGINPATSRLVRYPVVVEGGQIKVAIRAPEPGSGGEPPSGARARK